MIVGGGPEKGRSRGGSRRVHCRSRNRMRDRSGVRGLALGGSGDGKKRRSKLVEIPLIQTFACQTKSG